MEVQAAVRSSVVIEDGERPLEEDKFVSKVLHPLPSTKFHTVVNDSEQEVEWDS